MNKKNIISIGLVVALTSALSVNAEGDKTIYTDGIGRIHFLGRDSMNTVNTGTKYTNPAVQELTKKLYEQTDSSVEESDSYKQYPLKNYINTFPSSRYTETKLWKPVDEATAEANKEGYSARSSATGIKGQTDYSGNYQYGSTYLDSQQTEQNATKTSEKKKHWWNKKNK